MLVLLALFCPGPPGIAAGAADPGERIYQERCARCHGPAGEGVKGKHSGPLVGDKSVPELARYIAQSMPEDKPGTCTGREAEEVARFIHGAFYSPIAQARNRKARIELSRLTVRQYRNAVTDLVGGFREAPPTGGERGLRGQYFDSFRPGRNAVLERVDPQVRFDFGKSNPDPEKLKLQGFAARWEGSVHAPDTGEYEFIVNTDHSTRLWVNDLEQPLIDAWVKSGSGTEHRGSLFLVGGREYPLRLEFSSRQQGVQDKKKKKDAEKPVAAFIDLTWKPPHQPAEVVPSRRLAPERAPEVFVLGTPFPPDDRSIGFERGTSISRAWDEAATEAAMETAGYVAAHLDELAGLRKEGGDRRSRVEEFCRRLVERAFRRPLTGDEARLYLERRFGEAPDLEAALKRAVLLALKSPRFLYLDLEGGGSAAAPDAHAVASRLSFALWDSLPDRELIEAAASGRLASREQALRQAERMIQDPRARSKARQFLKGWLGVEQPPDLSKDPERYAGFGERLAADLRESLELFLEEVVWGESSDFRQLLLSSDLYLNGRAARFYGFDLPEDAPFQKVVAEGARRAGVLSHPYLLARFAYTDSSSPIHRGVFISRSLLGRVLRPPPEAFAPLSPALHPDLTTRERVALQTGPDECQSCHGMINPLGFALERYDAVGRYREEERGKPVDSSGLYRLPSGEVRTFDGARELAEFLARSEEAQRAFVSQLFHHQVKQPILAYGDEAPGTLYRTFAASGFSIRKLMVEIAVTVAWGLDSPGSKGYHGPGREDPRRRSF